jgi:hypothetical protein
MSINVIKTKGSKRKYVEIFTHHIGIRGALSRRTNTKQRESPEIAGRNTKANIF